MPVTGQGLADLLSGAGGAPVDRPALNNFVATSQARNGLVSAQTQDAMLKASQAQEEQAARARLKDNYVKSGLKDSDAQLAADISIGGFGNAEVALKALGQTKLGTGTPEEQVSGQQMYEGKRAPLEAVPNNYAVPPGQAPPTVLQSPQGVAQTAEMNALAGLNAHKDTNPSDFRNPPQGFGGLTPEENAAVTKAVAEGRQDPTRINSRNAKIIAQMELANPGTNFNRLHADAALQSNATFQQRAMSVDMLPGLLSHVTTLGKKLNGGAGYSDLKSVGIMQQWANGQTNDPDYTEYMTARNDTLLRLAAVMRGVGMSDQAHTAEIEAMAPTLAPYALDAWLKGQMSVVTPLLERQRKITNLGEPGHQGPSTRDVVPPAAPGAPALAAPAPPAMSLDDYLKSQGH